MRTRRLIAAAAGAGAVLATALTACSSPPPAPSNVIAVDSNQCGGPWKVPGPGWHTFQIANNSTGGGEIYLVNPANDAVFDEVEFTGPGTTTPMRVNLGSGKYAFLCSFSDYNPQLGPTVTIPGNAKGSPAVLPISFNDITPLAKKYEAYAEAGLKVLSGQTATLAADVKGGDLARAKRDWLTAHLQYQTLGAAYGTFGDFDEAIDGRADVTGVSSPDWTGFYRLEYGLWHGQSAATLTPVAAKLASDVNGLLASWPTAQVPQLDIGLRTHEILENALEFQLTGHDDYGSGTTLATTLANINGTRELLSLLKPLLTPRYPGLPSAYAGLDRLQSLLEKEQQPNGAWVPVSALPTRTRQAIDAACSSALQALAPIASITEPRSTPSDF